MPTTAERPLRVGDDDVTVRSARRRRRRRAGTVARWVALGFAIAWCILPLYWMLSTSFKTYSEATRLDPTLWPHTVTGHNYDKLFGGSLPFANFLVNSVITSVAAAVVALAFATLAAYSLSRARYRLRGTVSYAVLVVRMLPLVVLVGPLYLLLLKGGLLGGNIGLIVGFSTFGIPFATWMMKSFIDAVPIEVEEAARVDGYPRIQILYRVVLPLVLPGLLTTGTFVFMEAWNNLLYPLTLVNTLPNQTLPAGLVLSFTGQFKTDWGGMMAAATITTLPVMAAFFAVQRSMVRGLTSGAVAGE